MSTIPTLTVDLQFSYERPEDMRHPRAVVPSTNAASAPSSASSIGPRKSGPKPKVLILGRILAEDDVRAKLDAVAQVHNIIATADIDVPTAIQKAAKEHGPFEAVGVGLACCLRSSTAIHVKLTLRPSSAVTRFPGGMAPPNFRPSRRIPSSTRTRERASTRSTWTGSPLRESSCHRYWTAQWADLSGAYFANAPLEVGRRTADATVSLILTITRGLSTQFLHARAGKWKDPSIKALDWRGKTLGILGLGNIGSQVADMATGLGFKVIYSNRHRAEDEPYEFVSREELFKRADVRLLLTPLTDETRGLINKRTIKELKDGVIIVNVCECRLRWLRAALMPARGPVVVEQDLVDALESGKGEPRRILRHQHC